MTIRAFSCTASAVALFFGVFGGCSSSESPNGPASAGAGANGGTTAASGGGPTGGTLAAGGSSTGGVSTPGSGGTAPGTGGTGKSGTGGMTSSGGVAGSPQGTGGQAGSANGGTATGGIAGSAAGGSGTGGATLGGNGGTSGGGGSGQTGGSSGGASPKSDLPAPPTTGVPKPAGTPENLTVVDWAGFEGAVSFTFDDSNSSQIQNYAMLQALGVPFTFYLQTGKSESMNEVWAQALTDGHELGNHTRNHSSNDDGSDTDAATQFIESNFDTTVYTMAAPNGSGVYTDIARTRFLINRGVSNTLIMPNDSTDPFTLPCYIPPTGASASTMNQQIDSAESGGGWRTVLVHGFTGGSDGAFQPVALSEFVSTVNHAKTLNLWLDSVVNVAAYWRAQKAFMATQPATAGGDTTYTWTLPDHFPPGKFIRVRVDGGTLRQGGTTLSWDEHGYYEVALDPETLTLSP